MRKPVGRSPSGAVIEAFWPGASPSVVAKAGFTWTLRHSAIERDADADRDHGEQRLELGHPIAQVAVGLGQALLAGPPDAGQLEGRADASDQLARPERLHQIVVGAGLDAR